MGKRINAAAKFISKAAGAADLVDYAGSKIAKARAKGLTKALVEDKTSGKKALKSAGQLAAAVIPAGGVLKAMRMAKAAKALKKPELPLDRVFRRQDEEMWNSRGYKTAPGGKIKKMGGKK